MSDAFVKASGRLHVINDLMMWRKGLFVPLSLQRTTFRLFSDPGLAPLGQRFNGAVDYGVLVF